MNKKIGVLLREENAYKTWQNQILENNKDENYFSLFNNKVYSHNVDEEFIVYIPDEVGFDENNTQIAIGVDITLPNKDQGLIFYENKAVTITLEEAQKLDKNLVFIGINKINRINV